MKTMNRIIYLFLAILFIGCSFAEAGATKILLLVTEQNIAGPQTAWWLGEIDLSSAETIIAQKLKEGGYTIIEPSSVEKIVRRRRAFRVLPLIENRSVKLARLAKADYLLIGQAVASAGLHVPQSNLRSYFGNITARLIRVRDGKVLSYFDASGNAVHADVVTGGKEALTEAGQELAGKLLGFLDEGAQ